MPYMSGHINATCSVALRSSLAVLGASSVALRSSLTVLGAAGGENEAADVTLSALHLLLKKGPGGLKKAAMTVLRCLVLAHPSLASTPGLQGIAGEVLGAESDLRVRH